MNSGNFNIKSCDFCSIVRGDERSVEIVCSGRTWVAFFPLRPATIGHTLVVPRRHVADLWKLDPSQGSDLMEAVIKVGRAVAAALTPEGMNLITSAGQAAEQTVFHLHLHILPRWQNDGFSKIWPTSGVRNDSKLKDAANRIRRAFNEY